MKKGAMELSIGTIVIIVLAMSMLILGMVLVKTIFSGAQNVVEMNNNQLAKEMASIYGRDLAVALYPNVDIYKLKPGEAGAFAVRVTNLLSGDTSDGKFSYETTVDNFEKCNFGEREIYDWMSGESGTIGTIAPAGEVIEKVLLDFPEGVSLCKFRVRVIVNYEGKPIKDGQAQMYIELKG
ncbi:MAG: hypothetical protein KJ592_01500 [Nanoarchaeota archaeon]|nr:hypothetical protein [Nanoarchaeota archaeon]